MYEWRYNEESFKIIEKYNFKMAFHFDTNMYVSKN